MNATCVPAARFGSPSHILPLNPTSFVQLDIQLGRSQASCPQLNSVLSSAMRAPHTTCQALQRAAFPFCTAFPFPWSELPPSVCLLRPLCTRHSPVPKPSARAVEFLSTCPAPGDVLIPFPLRRPAWSPASSSCAGWWPEAKSELGLEISFAVTLGIPVTPFCTLLDPLPPGSHTIFFS